MILRKPYAFLIKYFKIIHLVLTFFSIYLIMRVNGILEFFNDFIGGTVGQLEAINYVSNLYILVIVLSILICLIVLILMKYKKKPYLLYIILIAVYLAIGLVLGFTNNTLEVISESIIGTKDLLLYRDILRILILFQYIAFFFVLVRALGFDIKKFDFDADLEGFSIVEEDDEEVELTLEDTNKYERKIRRHLRELRYYYVENRVYINVILVIVLVVFLSGFIVNKEVINKVYNEKENFSTDYFTFSVSNSYISNKGYDNKVITDTNTSFVIVKLNVKNRHETRELNTGKLLLSVNNNVYSSKVMYSKKFKDLGNVYTGNKINGQNTYIFIFNVSLEELDDDMYFVYGDKKVFLKPIDLDEVSKEVVYNIGGEVDMSNTFLGSGKFSIKSYELADKFNYSYNYYVSGQPFTGNLTIKSINNIILHLVIDASYSSDYDNYSLLSNYGVLKYKIGDVEYSSSFDNKTPSSYKEGIYVNVDKDILEADKIWFDLVLRNKRYIYNLK